MIEEDQMNCEMEFHMLMKEYTQEEFVDKKKA